MVDVEHPRCIHPECKTRPVFNTIGEKIALYCAEHKKNGMVDVKNKTCIHPECKTIPNFNTIGEKKALYCSEHKKNGMVDVIKPRCIHPGCKKGKLFNTIGEKKALYCSEHKKNGMVDVMHPMCKTHLCSTRVQEKYQGYCLRCYMYTFPDQPVSRNYKTKEFSVVDFIKAKHPDLTWVSDKTVKDGCSKKRPDLLLDLGEQIIMLEVDENKHNNYDCSCENKRMMELSQDVGHRPIILIRFNPDAYKQNGTKISSCWGLNKNHICVVKEEKVDEWTKRLYALQLQIEYWIHPEHTTDKTIEIIQLFYDE